MMARQPNHIPALLMMDVIHGYDKWEGNLKKSSHRDDLRIMIDAALRQRPDGFDVFMQMLEDAGCCIKRGAQISLKPPDGQRYLPGTFPIQINITAKVIVWNDNNASVPELVFTVCWRGGFFHFR